MNLKKMPVGLPERILLAQVVFVFAILLIILL
jgi:hypothetical protein